MESRSITLVAALVLGLAACGYLLLHSQLLDQRAGPAVPLETGYASPRELVDAALSEPAEVPAFDQRASAPFEVVEVIEEEEGDDDFEVVVSDGHSFPQQARAKPAMREIQVEVFSGAGEPVEAKVQVFAKSAGPGGMNSVAKEVSHKERGNYTLTLPVVKQPLYVVADAGSAGVGSVTWAYALSCIQNGLPISIEVRGAGRIVGRVVDASGFPVARLRLCAIQAGPDPAAPFSGSGNVLSGEHLIEGAGRGRAYTTTDASGEFSIQGLREEPFVLVTGLTTERYLAQREPMARIVATAYPVPVIVRLRESQLFVHVTTPTLVGEPTEDDPGGRGQWPSIEVDLYDLGAAAAMTPQGMTPHRTTPDASVPVLRRDVLGGYGQRLVDGHYVFQAIVEEGRHYGVRARQGERSTPIQKVEVTRAGCQVFLELSLPRRPIVGELRVFVRFAAWEDDYPKQENAAYVYLVDDETGLPVKARWEGSSSSADGMSTLAPLGRLRVVAEGCSTLQHPEVMNVPIKRRHGRASTVVELTATGEQQVEITLPLGGAVRVTASTARPLTGATSGWKYRIRLNGMGELRGDEYESLYHIRGGGIRSSRMWTLGEPMTSECIPVGRYLLTATLGSWPPIEKEIDVKSGATTDLELLFE